MTKNNVVNHVNEQIQHLHFKMHKKKKHWVIIGVSALALLGGIAVTNTNSTATIFSKLPHVPSIKNNRLSIKNSYSHGSHGPTVRSSRGIADVNPRFKEYSAGEYEHLTQGQDEGSPQHVGTTIDNPPHPFTHRATFDKDNIGKYHGSLEYYNLQQGSGRRNVTRIHLDKHTKPSHIDVIYPKSARVLMPHKDSKGNVTYKKAKVDVGMRISNIQYYEPWRGERSIVLSHDLAQGLYYNGIKDMDIHYHFILHNGNFVKLDGSYLKFMKINGLSHYHWARQYTEDDSTNNEGHTQWMDRFTGWFGNRGFKNAYDETGETVTPSKPGEKAYRLSNDSIMRSYHSNLFNRNVIGGQYSRTGSKIQRSIIMSLTGDEADVNAGSALGYGSYHPLTSMSGVPKPPKPKPKRHHKRKPPKPNPGSNPKGITKWLSNINVGSDGYGKITHRNQSFNYNLKGSIPYRERKNAYHLDPYQVKQFAGFQPEDFNFLGQHWHWDVPVYNYITKYHKVWYDGYRNSDHYTLTDNLPKDVTASSVSNNNGAFSRSGVQPTIESDGDHQVVKMHLNAQQMDELNHSRNYHLTIHVKANNLPQDSSISDNNADDNSNETKDYGSQSYSGKTASHSGSNQPVDNSDSINSNGWYKFWNGQDANGGTSADEQVYQSKIQDGNDYDWWNNPDTTKTSNKVGVKIRKIKYTVNHYDYGSDSGQFIPGDEVANHGYNDQYHGQNIGVLKSYTGYGFEGDTVPIKIMTKHNGNAEYGEYDNGTGMGNDRALYRFGYGNYDWVFPKLGYKSDNGVSNSTNKSGFSQKFWKPYVLPHAKITHFGRFMVSTDKQENNLPFRLDLKSDAFDYRDNWIDDDYGNDKINVNITSNGTSVYSTQVKLSDYLNETHHGKKLFEFKGKLNTNRLARMSKGSKVPLKVHVSFDDPSEAELEGITADSHAWISDEHNVKGNDFKGSHKDTASYTAPERTIKYFSTDDDGEADTPDTVRTMKEKLIMRQRHDNATATTGLGLRSNLSLDYLGHINAKNYGYNGTDTDFAFPNAWTNGDNEINYSNNPYNNSLVDNPNGTAPNGKSISDMENWDNSHLEHGLRKSSSFYNKADKADRLTHANSHWSSGYGAVSDDLDTVNGMPHGNYYKDDVDEAFGNAIPGLKSNGMPNGDTPGHYSTDYQFYPRAIQRPSGVVQLQHDENVLKGNSSSFDDALTASNQWGTSSNFNNKNAITDINNNRMYTPLWLPLGYYNTSFEKAMPSSNGVSGFNGDVESAPSGLSNWYDNSNDKRLGGNFFNFEDNMFDQFKGHEYLADNSKSEKLDDISIQPVLGGSTDSSGKNSNGQTVKGFSQQANDWVQFKNQWSNFFGVNY